MSTAKRLREIVNQQKGTIVPGAPNAVMARVIEETGFPVVFLSGAGISNWKLAIADYGLTTLTEVVEVTAEVTSAVSIPVLVDADTGYGNPLNVIRTVRELERAGAAGIMLEDQVFPKRCGHFDHKQVIPADEMVQKIKAATDSRVNEDVIIVARTDAIAVDGIEAAIERAHQYHEAGADVTFVEAPQTYDQMKRIGQLPWPQVANMVEGGKTPILPQQELQEIGFSLIYYANAIPRAALRAAFEAARKLMETGTSVDIPMLSWQERQSLVKLPELSALEKRYQV
ncbi:isocitrate lyase/PEP mutase family protein [Alicyclobacillus cycloheptanicus]|jgi:2-methylisocitrate lyase-like PEP mutase family enzyme|uniref:2-methylisocitrate lyase-like PEP mutase family enzyme n=1 Tax=Alicyclobacillus cycloheptanicus TaxID=1457 RepID=A0ABT9XJA0_9BACL|nr:isocitrate lyase/PEP mutase family protein [Alicyclobacillus cycloheptanicus]MDQ0189858.1 2-methylisocitrate lyase-like PEP mutase family enzyme [Alicyclobacillus cycloheptanicus]WDM02458.1 isocitrate lyase/PEP mutase family protein [Alicyclobacillus cycloheptanicus]